MVYWPHAVKNPMEANIEGKNIYFPKKPDIIDAINGRKIIESSIIILSTHLFAQL